MSEGFIHSIKVPRLYKATSTIVKRVIEDGESLKQLIYNKKHPNIKALYALAATTLQHATELNEIVRKTELFYKEPRLDPWLARVLITELFWGKQSLKADAKPIQTILTYENQLREELKNVNKISPNSSTPFIKVGKPRYIRINTLLMNVNEAIDGFKNDGYTLLPQSNNYEDFLVNLRRLSQYTFLQDFHIPELFAFAPGTQFHNHPEYHSGVIILQDKASCLPAHLLNLMPMSTILDMCAAPGMKTSHLAAIINNKGIIYSVEMNQRRYSVLCDMVQSTNASCVKTIRADAMTLDERQCPDVEYILVDPSCSGSGMERLDYEATQGKCAPLRLKSLQSFQVLLLRHALLTFTKAKRVVYSTCSIYPEENEMVVDEILSDIGDAYQLVPIRSLLNNQWLNYSSSEFKCQDNCLYAKSDVDLSNGFFVAVFERNFDIPLPEYKRQKGMNKNNCNNDNNSEIGNSNGDVEKIVNDEKRKKKKSKNPIDGLLEKSKDESGLNENVGIIDDAPPRKKRKKKSAENMLEKDEKNSNSIATDDISADKSSKKKKKKKELTEESLPSDDKNSDVDNDELEKTKNKKKKKKKKDKKNTTALD